MKKIKQILTILICLLAPVMTKAQAPAYGDGLYMHLESTKTGGWLNTTVNTASGPLFFSFMTGDFYPFMSSTVNSITIQYVNPVKGERGERTISIGILNDLPVGGTISYGVSGAMYRITKKPGITLYGGFPSHYIGTFSYVLYINVTDPE